MAAVYSSYFRCGYYCHRRFSQGVSMPEPFGKCENWERGPNRFETHGSYIRFQAFELAD